ncbi:MAG TPA: hypothetical protein VJU14_08405 [Solirubrobacterales bacterium]|nr:hypothetical protein [Solirubrobacterales bacterium]
MNTPRPYKRLALFVAGLAAVFVVAAAVGSLFEPAETEAGKEEKMGAHTAEAAHGGREAAHGGQEAGHEPAGLGIAADGYSLRIASTQLARGEAEELSFQIEDAEGRPVTDFDELHERRMHLIVVRRDGTEFRHLHPEMDAAGIWTVPLELDRAGVYRAFADFSVEGGQQTLAGDLFVSGGEFEARPFPPALSLDEADGYEVRLRAGDPVAGEPTSLEFSVGRNGDAVDGLSPYLGAKGHLVALREGDLAFLHVHPEEGDEVDPEEIVFAATFPTAGRYRLYLQFKHEGAVRTVEFTVEVPR